MVLIHLPVNYNPFPSLKVVSINWSWRLLVHPHFFRYRQFVLNYLPQQLDILTSIKWVSLIVGFDFRPWSDILFLLDDFVYFFTIYSLWCGTGLFEWALFSSIYFHLNTIETLGLCPVSFAWAIYDKIFKCCFITLNWVDYESRRQL